MKWEPISEVDLLDKINSSYKRMNKEQQQLWDIIKVNPHKWEQKPYGDEGGGFWVVAVYGNNIIWYNDIEDGFNRSKYSTYGKITDYGCSQDNLEWTIDRVITEIKTGK